MHDSLLQTIRSLTEKLLVEKPDYYTSPHEAEQEVWWLVSHITKLSKTSIITHKTELTANQENALNRYISERIEQNKPLAYIIGHVPFCDLEIEVTPPTLIPRPETEEIVLSLLKKLKPVQDNHLEILDLCTGSGCIGLALAHALPKSRVTGIDISSEAIALANANKARNNIRNIEFIQGDLFERLTNKTRQFDIIIANPPYIAENLWNNLNPEVKDWEDKRALVADNNGLALYYSIITQAPQYLKQNSVLSEHHIPRIVFEIDPEQAAPLTQALTEHRFSGITAEKDLFGITRSLTGCYAI